MRNLLYLIYLICITFNSTLFSQTVDIYTKDNSVNPVAVLDVQADSSGILIPRTDTSTIENPVEGLLIYDTTAHTFRFYDGSSWQTLLPQTPSTLWYADQDGDGYGNPFSALSAPTAPEFYVDNNLDCNDNDSAINPDATEKCDGIDNNCDELIDDDDPEVDSLMLFYPDEDSDTYGDKSDPGVMACVAPEDYVDNNLDCDDTNAAINPDADEICDGIDNDCDAAIDDNDSNLQTMMLFYPDEDSDNYGDESHSGVMACNAPVGHVANNLDCDDTNAAINPNADEICNGIDDDCDTTTDEDVVVDDGLACTTESCQGGAIVQEIEMDHCVIDGVCYSSGESNPSNECQECDANTSQTEWTNKDGEACSGGMCQNGNCIEN